MQILKAGNSSRVHNNSVSLESELLQPSSPLIEKALATGLQASPGTQRQQVPMQQPAQLIQEPDAPDPPIAVHANDAVEAPQEPLEDEDDDFEIEVNASRASPSHRQPHGLGRPQRRTQARQLVSSSDEEEEEKEEPMENFIVPDDSERSESEGSVVDRSNRDGDLESNYSDDGSNTDEGGRSGGCGRDESGVEWGSEGLRKELEELQVCSSLCSSLYSCFEMFSGM